MRDVEVDESGIQLVMDYVEGASLSELIPELVEGAAGARPEAVSLRIVLDACEGLGALHELTGDDGEPLGLVHRDISPANVLVGLDGVARIADFGLAKPLLAVERTTSEGALRGKLGYMAPEYIRGKSIDRRIDVFAMGIVLWEVLAGKRLFRGENDGDTLDRVQTMAPPLLADVKPELGRRGGRSRWRHRARGREGSGGRLATIAAARRASSRRSSARTTSGRRTATSAMSFPPALRAELDDRRRRVQSATGASGSQPPPSVAPSQPPAVLAPSQPPPPASAVTRPGRALAALGGAVVIVGIGVVVLVASRSSETPPPSAGAPHVVASEVGRSPVTCGARRCRRGNLERHARLTEREREGRPTGGRPLRPTSDEPGKKPPRPNPYASSAAPR